MIFSHRWKEEAGFGFLFHAPFIKSGPLRPLVKCLFAILPAAALLGCAATDAVKVFYIDKNVLQYYVHPSEFKGTDAKAEIDFTYRDSRSDSSWVTCNFSLFNFPRSKTQFEKAFFLLGGSDTVPLNSVALLFIEGSVCRSRYTSRMSPEGFDRVMSAKRLVFRVEKGKTGNTFSPSRAFYKKMKAARLDIAF